MQLHHHLPTPTTTRPATVPATADDQGFSLIELIVVVMILGIMASAVVVAVSGMRADAADSRCAADRRTLAVAAEAYLAEYSTDPLPASGIGHDRFERRLVDTGFLRAVSTIHDIDAAGVVQPEGTSPC